MKTLKFDTEPEFPELWDVCLHSLLYKKESYVSEVLDLFEKLRISRSSRILDSCAGTGFIVLDLRKMGFNVDCMDLMEDEIEYFQQKAKLIGVDPSVLQSSWKQMHEEYDPETYDFLFCRGNSFIYAAGGWNESHVVGEKLSLQSYEETLRMFYEVLKSGGYLYIDKFPDDEKPHKDVVAKIRVRDKEKELLFCTNRLFSKKYREAALTMRDSEGIEVGSPNVSYDLSEIELEGLLRKVGFTGIRKLDLKSEKNFVVWLAQK